MKLSERLTCITTMIPNNSRVIDVGCDHGLLSIYLNLNHKCDCIAADINQNALNGAIENIKKYHAWGVTTKLTDGICDIDINADDIIVIAGMGTTTIKHILTNKKLSNTIILASNNQWFELRKYMYDLGYKINEERFVIDKGKKYVIIKFEKGNADYKEVDLMYGPLLKTNKTYLIYELDKLNKIKNQIKKTKYLIRIKNFFEIQRLKKLIKKAKEN